MRDEGEKRAICLGAVVGALSGATLAVLYRRWRRQRQVRGAKLINARQAVRLGVAVLSVLRQIMELIS